MEQKIKFILIGSGGLLLTIFLLFATQSVSQQQKLTRENKDLKAENTALTSRAEKFENDLREMQGRMAALRDEKEQVAAEISGLQRKIESLNNTRDDLIEKLKKKTQAAAVASAPVASAQPMFTAPGNSDAYWGSVLKAKKDLEMQLSSIQTELRTLQISNEALQRNKNVLEIDVNSLRNDKKDLLRQLDYNQKLLDSMSEEVVRERNDKVAIQESLKTIKSENSVLSRQLKSLVARKEALDKRVQNLQDDKTTVQNRLNEMETMLTDRISKIGSLKNELDAIKSGKTDNLDPVGKAAVELPAIVVHSAAAGKPGVKNEIKEFPGKILAVNLDSNFVVIDLGSAAGVKAGDVFNVYRDAKAIGSVSVIQTRANISACDIKRMNPAFKIGDSVK